MINIFNKPSISPNQQCEYNIIDNTLCIKSLQNSSTPGVLLNNIHKYNRNIIEIEFEINGKFTKNFFLLFTDGNNEIKYDVSNNIIKNKINNTFLNTNFKIYLLFRNPVINDETLIYLNKSYLNIKYRQNIMRPLVNNTNTELFKFLNKHNINKKNETINNDWLPQSYYRKIANSQKIYTFDNNKLCLMGKKIFICGGCELSYIYHYLKNICSCYHTFESKTSMHILDELHNENSFIKQFNADYYILSNIQDIKKLFPIYRREIINNCTDKLKVMINNYIDKFSIGIDKLKLISNKPVFLLGPLYLSEQKYFGQNDYLTTTFTEFEIYNYILIKMINLCRNKENVYLLNTVSMFERYNKFDCIESHESPRYGHLTYYGSCIVAEEFYNQICLLDKNLTRIKCVVIDCDNTLWNGVLIEDGEDKIDINQKIANILLTLVSRGIIISLCSKNPPKFKNKILNLISTHWCATDLKKYLVSIKINWQPKSQNIIQIAKELNIGLDTIAFFDDSEFERREVSVNIPEVNVYRDIDIYFCLNNPIFDNYLGKLTEASKKRIDTYINNEKRLLDYSIFKIDNDLSSDKAFEKFMIKSKFKLSIYKSTEDDICRINELIQRTNQLNATLKRTEYGDIKNYINNINFDIYCISLIDKYSDYGTVGTIILKKNDDNIEILELAISCRAMGKKVEDAIIIFILNKYNKNILINIQSNIKNNSLINTFTKYNFKFNNGIYTHMQSNIKYEKISWF